MGLLDPDLPLFSPHPVAAGAVLLDVRYETAGKERVTADLFAQGPVDLADALSYGLYAHAFLPLVEKVIDAARAARIDSPVILCHGLKGWFPGKLGEQPKAVRAVPAVGSFGIPAVIELLPQKGDVQHHSAARIPCPGGLFLSDSFLSRW